MYRIALAATLALSPTLALSTAAHAQTPPPKPTPDHSQHMAPAPKTPVTPFIRAWQGRQPQ